MRHFSTPLNARSVSRGWLSTGIDKDEAEKLAPGVAKTLEDYGVDQIASSDLPRAEESADLISRHMKGDVETTPTDSLRTWNVGDMAGKKESETIPMRQKLIKYPEEKPKGGEPFQDFLDRYRPELQEIVERRQKGEGVAMVAHGHQLLAAKHILQDEEVDPDNLPTLDEKYKPGTVYGFWIQKDGTIKVEPLGASETHDPSSDHQKD